MFLIEKSMEIHGISKIPVKSWKIYVFMDKSMAVSILSAGKQDAHTFDPLL
jgi:hypothetical protein